MAERLRRTGTLTLAVLLVAAACGGPEGSAPGTSGSGAATAAGSETEAAIPPREFTVRASGDTTFEHSGTAECSGDGGFSMHLRPAAASPDVYVVDAGPVTGPGTYEGTILVSPDPDAVPINAPATVTVEKAEPAGNGLLTALAGTVDATLEKGPLGMTDLTFEWKCWVYADELDG